MATSKWYGLGRLAVDGGDVDLAAATVVAILCDSTYTPDQDVDEFVTDLVGECTDASYGRVTLTGKALTYTAGTNTVKWTCDPIVFAALSDTFRHLVLAVSTGSDATSRLLKWTDFEGDQVAAGVDVTITPAASGLGTVVVG